MSDNANQAPGTVVTWNEVKDGAGEVFNVWVLGSELEWAECAWAMLEKAGLTTYRDAVPSAGRSSKATAMSGHF